MCAKRRPECLAFREVRQRPFCEATRRIALAHLGAQSSGTRHQQSVEHGLVSAPRSSATPERLPDFVRFPEKAGRKQPPAVTKTPLGGWDPICLLIPEQAIEKSPHLVSHSPRRPVWDVADRRQGQALAPALRIFDLTQVRAHKTGPSGKTTNGPRGSPRASDRIPFAPAAVRVCDKYHNREKPIRL